jgi:hypothetical protein
MKSDIETAPSPTYNLSFLEALWRFRDGTLYGYHEPPSPWSGRFWHDSSCMCERCRALGVNGGGKPGGAMTCNHRKFGVVCDHCGADVTWEAFVEVELAKSREQHADEVTAAVVSRLKAEFRAVAERQRAVADKVRDVLTKVLNTGSHVYTCRFFAKEPCTCSHYRDVAEAMALVTEK